VSGAAAGPGRVRDAGLAVAATIVLTAAAQAGLVALAAVPSSDIGYMLMAAASLVVAIASSAVLATILAGALERDRDLRRALPTGGTLGWAALIAVVAFLAAILLTVLVPFVLVVGLVSLPSVAAGRHPRAGFAALRSNALRSVLAVVVSIAAVALAWVLSLALGLLVTGWLGAAITWLAFGTIAALLLWWWSARSLRTPAAP